MFFDRFCGYYTFLSFLKNDGLIVHPYMKIQQQQKTKSCGQYVRNAGEWVYLNFLTGDLALQKEIQPKDGDQSDQLDRSIRAVALEFPSFM